MPERALVNQSVAIGAESTSAPGTRVPATRKLGALSVGMTPQVNKQTFKPQGQKFPTVAVLVSETTTYPLSGMGTYNEVVYPLASAFSVPVISTPGGATLTRDWTFELNGQTRNTQQTYTVESGDDVRNTSGTWMQVTEFGMEYSRANPVNLSGSAIGQYLLDDKVRTLIVRNATSGTFVIDIGAGTTASIQYNAAAAAVQSAIRAVAGNSNVVVSGSSISTTGLAIDFSADYPGELPSISTADTLSGTGAESVIARMNPLATQLPLVPISPTTINVDYSLTSYSALISSPTRADRTFSLNWKVSNRNEAFMPLNSAYGVGFAGVVESDGMTSEVKFWVAANAEGGAMWRALRQGSKVWLRVQSVGPLIEGSLYHTFTHYMCLEITNIGEFNGSNGQLIGNEFTAVFAYDPTWGKATQIVCRTNIASL